MVAVLMALTSQDYRQVLDIIDLVYTIHPRHILLRAVFERLEKLIGFTSAAYVPWNGVTQAFQLTGNYIVNASQNTLATYLQEYSICDPFVETQSHLTIAINRAVKITDYITVLRYAETRYARELAPLIPCFYEMNVMLSHQGYMIGGIALHRVRRDGDFKEREREIMSLIAPRLAMALHWNAAQGSSVMSITNSGQTALLRGGELDNASDGRRQTESLAKESGLWIDGYGLTRRQKEVAVLTSRGMSNREIAEQLFICEQTVKDHLREIFDKLKVKRRSQLASFMYWNKEGEDGFSSIATSISPSS